MLQAGRSPVRVPNEVDFFNLPNPSSRTMTLGSTQPLTEMSSRKFPGGKGRPSALRLKTLPPFVSRMTEQCGSLLTALRASMACTGIALPYLGQINPLHTNTFSFLKLDVSIILQFIHRSLSRSVPLTFSHYVFMRSSSL
jgi:hypothetical protein